MEAWGVSWGLGGVWLGGGGGGGNLVGVQTIGPPRNIYIYSQDAYEECQCHQSTFHPPADHPRQSPGHSADHHLLEQGGHTHCQTERPAEQPAERGPEDPRDGPPPDERGGGEHGGVHGEGAREEGGGGVEHPRAGDGEDEVEETDAAVDGLGDGGVETRFGAGAEEREEDAQAVELVGLGQGGSEEGEGARREGVEGDVGPAADGVLGGVLPGLEAVAVGEVVGGLPEVEDCGGGVRGGVSEGGRGEAWRKRAYLHRSRGSWRRRRRAAARRAGRRRRRPRRVWGAARAGPRPSPGRALRAGDWRPWPLGASSPAVQTLQLRLRFV